MSSSTIDECVVRLTRIFLLSGFACLIFLNVSPEVAFAQGCCTVGASSVHGLENGVQSYQTLRLGLNYQFNSVARAYSERERIDDPLRRTASVSYFSIYSEYGLAPRVSVYASLLFSDKKREITVTNANSRFAETATFGASGIGDMILLAKYQIVRPSILSPFELSLGGGASLPTGSFAKEQNNAQLSIDLQPGTGSTVLIGWLHAMRSFPEQSIHLFATATYRYAGTNLDAYRIGDELVVGIGAEYSIDEHFAGSLTLRSRFAAQDYANRRTLNATGGTYHDLMPSLSYGEGASHIRVFGQIPIYRNVRGIQLTLAYLLGIEYGYSFDFSDLVSASP